MRGSIAVLLSSLLALFCQSAGATNYHVYRKFETVCHSNQLKRCSRHRCTSGHMDLTRDTSSPCQRSFEPRIFDAIAFVGWIDPASHRQSEPSTESRVAQTDTAKTNVPKAPSTKRAHRRSVLRRSPSGTRRWWHIWHATRDTWGKGIPPRGWSVSRSPSIGRATS